MELGLKTLLSLSLAGSALGMILMLVNRLLGKRIFSGFIYFAWLLVLLRFVLPLPGLLVIPTPAPLAQSDESFAVPEQTDTAAGRTYAADSISNPGTAGTEEALPSATVSKNGAVAGEQAAKTEDSDASKQLHFPLWQFLCFVWAAGTVCAAGWSLSGYFRYRRALYRTLQPAQEQERRTLNALHPLPWPALWRSGAVSTPLLLGLVRPVIVLPDRAYTPEMLDNILRHELTHYRRGDLAVKWFAAAVFSVHWFNPLVYLFRRELDRACELSCDERLLHNMDAHEKQSYGEMLLTLAADRPLPRRVVAMSFATEKRNLKERLVQIMTYKKKGWAALAIMLAVTALLAGCAMVMGPAAIPSGQEEELSAQVRNGSNGTPNFTNAEEAIPTAAPEDPIDSGNGPEIYVDSVDAFLSALGSDRAIILRPGTYNLSEASDYGGPAAANYSWAETGDGYELVLNGLERLTIIGEPDAGSVSIVTEPRYANVLRLENCRTVVLDQFTAGHTLEQGYCTGGVLYLNGCDNVFVNGCVLYGCGTLGINALNCRRVFAEDTVIKECSYGAMRAQNCYDIRFTNGKIFDCGLKSAGGCFNLLDAIATTGFAVHNTELYDNSAMLFLSASNSIGVELRGCEVQGNQFNEAIRISGNPALIDGCALGGNAIVAGWYVDPDHPAVDADGNELSPAALKAMQRSAYTDAYNGPAVEEASELPFVTGADGRAEYYVTTADEFLAAIGSDRVIYLGAALFDLSSAGNYGGYGGANYYWQATYDGPGLVISGVSNMRIVGLGRDQTSLETLPRYADVLSFLDCREVTVEGLTAGHTKGAGSCSGDVLSFRNCTDCTVLSCGLFGCGVNGINACGCENLTVQESDIYACSGFGAVIQDCVSTAFSGCAIRDCTFNTIWVRGIGEVTWDGKTQEQVQEMFTSGQE